MVINDHKTTESQGPRTINLCDDFIDLLKDFPNRYFVTNEKFELYKDSSGISKKMKKYLGFKNFTMRKANSSINLKSIGQNFSDEQELVLMGGKEVNSRAYLSRFNFSGSEQNKKVSLLSGGERNRLHLAMTLKEEGNVLLLDEPTNDLDVNTLRALEEGLENFAGCAVVISHDRWFLDRICTHILAFEGDSQVYFFEGGFSEYEANKKKRLGGDLMPKRIKYKKLIR